MLLSSNSLVTKTSWPKRCCWASRESTGAKTPKVEERTELIRLAGLLRYNREQTERELEVAFRNNPAANLKASLNQPLRDHLASTDAFLHAIDSDVINARTSTITQDAYDRLIQPCLKANSGLWYQAVKDLDACCRPVSTGLYGRKNTIVAIRICR